MDKEQLYGRFKEKAELVSAEVYRVTSVAQAFGLVEELYHQFGLRYGGPVKTAVVCPPWLESDQLTEAVIAGRGEILASISEEGEKALVGIAAADWAIAETGTLVQDATDVYLRMATTLPLISIIFANTTSLVPDLSSALSRYAGDMPGHLAFITGPSRTADIERVLTIGVHGPERLIVIFIDGEGGGRG
ncbi:MAG: LutC/YkgG family protein [Bacillota bacterium]